MLSKRTGCRRFVAVILIVAVYWSALYCGPVCASNHSLWKAEVKQPPCPRGTYIQSDGLEFKCVPCQSCPPGFQPSLTCGANIRSNRVFLIRCVPCAKGFFSSRSDSRPCRACRKCGDGFTAPNKCSSRTDTICGPCKKGYYHDSMFLDCFPCTHCCGDSRDYKVKSCSEQGLPGGLQCSVHNRFRCPLTDVNTTRDYRVLWLGERFPDSTRKSIPTTTNKPVTTSSLYHREISTTENIAKKGKTVGNVGDFSNTPNNNTDIIIITTVSTVLILLLMFSIGCFMYIRRKCSMNADLVKGGTMCYTDSTGKTTPVTEEIDPSGDTMCYCQDKTPPPETFDASDQTGELDDWASHDVNEGMYTFNAGIRVRYNKRSKADSQKILAVEELRDEEVISTVNYDPNQVFLSPIFQFYSKGETFEMPVEVNLSHSALTGAKDAWELTVLYADIRRGEKVKWQPVERGTTVNMNQVKFITSKLLAYVVVGVPKDLEAGAKKRMQFAVFADQEVRAGKFRVNLYLFDDVETKFLCTRQEELSRGRCMLGSFYAAFIDCYKGKSVTVSIKNTSKGWKLEDLSPESISAEQCTNSFAVTPRWEATFCHAGPTEGMFRSTFAVNAAGQEINIPALTCLPDIIPPFYIGPVEALGKDFPPDNLYTWLSAPVHNKLCRILDRTYHEVGGWRELAKGFGLSQSEYELCSKEPHHAVHSPTKVLLDWMEANMSDVTVTDLVEVLQQIGRYDVVGVLADHLEDKMNESQAGAAALHGAGMLDQTGTCDWG